MQLSKSSKLLANANIIIDYKTNKVKFHYPRKQSFFKGIMIMIFPRIFVYNGLLMMFFLLIANLPAQKTAFVEAFKFINWGYILFIFLVYVLFTYLFFVQPYLMSIVIYHCEKFRSALIEYQSRKGTYFKKRYANIKQNFIEIPLFRNDFLDYKATEDYATKLERVEITNLDFKLYSKKKVLNNNKLFKCKFIFSDIPDKGYIDIKFR